MATSIAASVARIKRDGLGALGRGVIERVCAELGHAWRDRELDPATTVALFVQQILHGNLPCSEVRHLAAAAVARGTRPARRWGTGRASGDSAAVFADTADRDCGSRVIESSGHWTRWLDGSIAFRIGLWSNTRRRHLLSSS